MLSSIRRLSRPLAVLTFLVFIAPGAAADCRSFSAMTGSAMSCCTQGSDDAGMKAECCAVGGEIPAPERAASTAASARSSSHALAAPAQLISLVGPVVLPPAAAPEAPAEASPPDRLFIRFASIRR